MHRLRRTGFRRDPALTRALSAEPGSALLLSACVSLRFRYFHGAGIVRLQSGGAFQMPGISRPVGARAHWPGNSRHLKSSTRLESYDSGTMKISEPERNTCG